MVHKLAYGTEKDVIGTEKVRFIYRRKCSPSECCNIFPKQLSCNIWK